MLLTPKKEIIVLVDLGCCMCSFKKEWWLLILFGSSIFAFTQKNRFTGCRHSNIHATYLVEVYVYKYSHQWFFKKNVSGWKWCGTDQAHLWHDWQTRWAEQKEQFELPYKHGIGSIRTMCVIFCSWWSTYNDVCKVFFLFVNKIKRYLRTS